LWAHKWILLLSHKFRTRPLFGRETNTALGVWIEDGLFTPCEFRFPKKKKVFKWCNFELLAAAATVAMSLALSSSELRSQVM
jgi:hypothetical protein